MNNQAGRQRFADNLVIVEWPQRRLGTGQLSLIPANALVGMTKDDRTCTASSTTSAPLRARAPLGRHGPCRRQGRVCRGWHLCPRLNLHLAEVGLLYQLVVAQAAGG